VQRYFERLYEAFHAAPGNAKRNGELRDTVSLRDETAFFTATVLGLFVTLRAMAPPATIETAARVAVEHLEALQVETSGA
jgi:hypothetical protein